MTEAKPRGRGGCLRTGCLGCLALFGVGILVVIALFSIALLLGKPEERQESSELTRELPPQTRSLVADPTSDVSEGDLPLQLTPPGAAVGRIVLDISFCEFELVPGPPGDPIRVEGDYDAGTYELVESLEQDGENGWTYRLRFGLGVSWIRTLLGNENVQNRIRLIVPRDVPLVLEGKVGLGESELELGGLWLTEVDLRVGVGAHAISFDEPTRQPLERFLVAGSMGETKITGLGNASPRVVESRNRMGSLQVGLRGEWTTDATVNVSCGVGECRVTLPDDVHVVLEDAHVGIGEATLPGEAPDPPPGAPTLTVAVRSRMGELAIHR